jgi:L-malate glycosyltransferase
MTKNILILPTAYPNIYNDHSAIFVQDQAEALVKYGEDVVVLGAIPISFKSIWNLKFFKFGYFKSTRNGVKIKLFLFPSIPKLKYFNNFIRNILNRILLKNHHQNNKIDLVHVHNATAGNAALWLKSKLNIPYCVTEHSTGYARNIINSKEMKIFKNIYKNSSTNIAVSQEFCILLSNIFDLKFMHIANVVDTQYFKTSVKKNKETKFNFINVGYLDKKKNQLLLIQAFKEAFHNKKDITLDVFGSGPELKNLNKEIKRLKLEGQVVLHGFATREVVLKALQTSDAFVLSSEYETFGVVLIEAMSCGLPVLSTKCGGPESIVINDDLGLLVEKNNVTAFSNGMETIVNKKYSSQVIREYVIDNFSQAAISNKLKVVYKEITN